MDVLVLTKRTTVVATRHVSWAQNMPLLLLRLRPDAAEGAYSAPQIPLLNLGAASRREVKGWKEREGKEKHAETSWRDSQVILLIMNTTVGCQHFPPDLRLAIPAIWIHRPRFAYSLYNFHGATMTIKGNLQIPIVNAFLADFWSKIWLGHVTCK